MTCYTDFHKGQAPDYKIKKLKTCINNCDVALNHHHLLLSNPSSSCSFSKQNSIALIIAATLSTAFGLGWLAFYIWLHGLFFKIQRNKGCNSPHSYTSTNP